MRHLDNMTLHLADSEFIKNDNYGIDQFANVYVIGTCTTPKCKYVYIRNVAGERMRQLIYIMMVMALLSSCQQKGDKNMTSEELMRKAIVLAEENVANGGGPFGAVIARNGEIIATGVNLVTAKHDPTAHAEVSAIRAACKKLGTFDLSGCEIYTSCEPCPMCLGAIYWAHIDKMYYGNDKADAKRIGFDDSFIYEEVALSPESRRLSSERMLKDEAVKAFDMWMDKDDKIEY